MMQQESTKTLIIATMLCVLAPGAVATTAQAAPSGWEDLARSFGGPQDGDVIVEQLPTRSGGPGSDTLFRYVHGEIVWQQVADNILLSQAAEIKRVDWWGFYGGWEQNHQPPTGDETMRVRFYSARPGDGLPGDVLYEESFLNLPRSATGYTVQDAPEFLFQTDLSSPVVLGAATPYWIEIVQVGDLESHFRWESGYGGQPGYAFRHTYLPEWQADPSSWGSALRLSTIPEPASVSLVALILGSTLKQRHRKEVRRR